jgi:hypothetical protein
VSFSWFHVRLDVHQLRGAGTGFRVWLLSRDEQRCCQRFELFHAERPELRRGEVDRAQVPGDRMRELLEDLREPLADVVRYAEVARRDAKELLCFEQRKPIAKLEREGP